MKVLYVHSSALLFAALVLKSHVIGLWLHAMLLNIALQSP